MRHLRIFIATAILPLGLVACGSGEQPVSEEVKSQASGPRQVIGLTQTINWQDVGAQIATEDQAQVLARIPGILTSLSVAEGDYVRRGQVIGRIRDSQLGYQASAYGAQAAAAQAQTVQAQANLKRVRYLFDNGVYTQARLDQAIAAARAADAQTAAARAQKQAVQAVSGQGALIAPASGRVLMADVPAGSPVAPGMPIATITAGPVVLKLDLPEALAVSVHPGSEIIASLPEGGELRGSISKIYPSVMGGQVRADAVIAGLDGSLIGRRISARLAVGLREALLVPQDYVSTAFGIDSVWIVPRDGPAASVPVQTAPSGEEGMVEILSGVQSGETIEKRAP